MLERVWQKENPPMLLMGMYIAAVTMKEKYDGLLKTKNRGTV